MSATPRFIFAMFSTGRKSSASKNSQPNLCASSFPTVVFPDPATPITRRIIDQDYPLSHPKFAAARPQHSWLIQWDAVKASANYP